MTTTTSPTRYASPGAVAQSGGPLPIRTCDRCGAEIVFVKSTKTGRYYPVNVSVGYNDGRFYMGHDLHARDCAETKAASFDAFRRDEAIRTANTTLAHVAARLATIMRRSVDADTDRLLSNLAIVEAAHAAHTAAINA